MTLSGKIRRFLGREDGLLSVEAVLVFPILIWAYVGLFVLVDAFQTKSVNIKAAATIGDLLSRETAPVNAGYIDGLKSVLDILVHSNYPTVMRVSVVRYDLDDDEFTLVWSHGTGTKPALTDATLSEIEPSIPAVQDAGSVIVVTSLVPPD